jgi:hypothetical protein
MKIGQRVIITGESKARIIEKELFGMLKIQLENKAHFDGWIPQGEMIIEWSKPYKIILSVDNPDTFEYQTCHENEEGAMYNLDVSYEVIKA